MTAVFVDRDGIDRLHLQIRRFADHAGATEAHVAKNAVFGWGDPEGVLMMLQGTHQAVYDSVTRALHSANSSGVSIATAINKCWLMYAQVDLDGKRVNERILEDAYRTGDHHALDDIRPYRHAGTEPPFADVEDPVSHLDALPKEERSEDFKFDPRKNLLSPTAYVRELYGRAFHVDPYLEIYKWVSGDWSHYAACAMMWKQIERACNAMSWNLRRAAADTPEVWRGDAAEAFQSQLLYLSEYVKRISDACVFYVGKYQEASAKAKEMYKAIEPLLAEMTDKLILAIASAGGAGALVKTIVGPVILGSAALVFLHQAKICYEKINEVRDRIEFAIEAPRAALEQHHANEQLGEAPMIGQHSAGPAR